MVIKKIIYKISIYKVLPPYKNWYSIMTNDGLNRSNVVIIGGGTRGVPAVFWNHYSKIISPLDTIAY